MGGPIINVSIFGSAARGERDKFSDLDVIAIVKDGAGKQDERFVLAATEEHNRIVPSISWYGEAKIRRLFEVGDLFAWHLFLESRPVQNFAKIRDEFGEPKDFKDAFASIIELEAIYDTIPTEIQAAPQNRRYELGICYVCFRNIAMAASWHLCTQPNFGRYSPYALGVPRFPLPRASYDLLWRCRISGQRGMTPPDTKEIDLQRVLEQGKDWIEEIKEVLLDGGVQSNC